MCTTWNVAPSSLVQASSCLPWIHVRRWAPMPPEGAVVSIGVVGSLTGNGMTLSGPQCRPRSADTLMTRIG